MTDKIEKRALYTLLRMSWINDPSLIVEPWQIENYRSLSLSDLFDRLAKYEIQLDRVSFISYASESESPEDLTEQIIGDRVLSTQYEDQIYLLIFELWRRLLKERPSVSLVCDAIDHQISLYDQNHLNDFFSLQDALLHFVQLLHRHLDEGVSLDQAFQLVSPYCAHDIESFLYDFLSEQLEQDNETFVQEVFDAFTSYAIQNKWLTLLNLRLMNHSHESISHKLIEKIIDEDLKELDLDFNLEFLSILNQIERHHSFPNLFLQTISLLKKEDDLHDLCVIGIEYLQEIGQVKGKQKLESLLSLRSSIPKDKTVSLNDPNILEITHLFTIE